MHLQEIISDLKSKLKSATESVLKSSNSAEASNIEVRGQPIKRQKPRPLFYVKFNQNIENNDSNKLEIKVLENQMSDDLSQTVIKTFRQLYQKIDSSEQLPEMLAKKLNKTLGKYWNCIIGGNVWGNSVLNFSDNNYLKFEFNEVFQIIVYKNNKDYPANTVPDKINDVLVNTNTNPAVKVLKSVNIEAQVEKFIVKTALDAMDMNFDDYYSLGSFVRNAICNKYSSQWFVSIGKSEHYCTSWALARNRKFILFEVDNTKFTIGEVGGWLW